jgi:competence protein ComEC
MKLAALLMLIAFLNPAHHLYSLLREASSPLHQLCLSRISTLSPVAPLYQAIACGQRIYDPSILQIFKDLGIVHLLVVSGAHLLWLESAIQPLTLRFSQAKWLLILLILALYTLVTQVNPPVTRAFFQHALRISQQKYNWKWTPTQLSLNSSILTLIIFPEWWFSLSFLLSAIASLALTVIPLRSKLSPTIFLFLVICPVLGGFKALSPISTLINLIVIPLWGAFVFPLAIFSVLFPFLTTWTDPICLLLLKSLSEMRDALQFTASSQPMAELHTWSLFLCLAATHYIVSVHCKRQQS